MKRLASLMLVLALAAGAAHAQGAWEYAFLQYAVSGSTASVEVSLPGVDPARFAGPLLEAARQAVRYVGAEPGAGAPTMLAVLNAMGSLGWEATGFTVQSGTHIHVFKRPAR